MTEAELRSKRQNIIRLLEKINDPEELDQLESYLQSLNAPPLSCFPRSPEELKNRISEVLEDDRNGRMYDEEVILKDMELWLKEN